MQVTLWRTQWKSGLPSLTKGAYEAAGGLFGTLPFTSLKKTKADQTFDIHETKKNFVVTSSVPVEEPKKLAISIFGNTLTIKGEKRSEDECIEKDFYQCDKVYSAFQRTVRLPSDVDAGDVRATFRDGVIRIVIPKSEKK